MNKPRYMYACVCDKCGREFTNEHLAKNELSENCTELVSETELSANVELSKSVMSCDAYRVICPKCTQLEGFKKPKASSKKKVAKPSLDDKLKELREYNAATGQRLTYGQYQAQHRTD